jgi:hypothetical protein
MVDWEIRVQDNIKEATLAHCCNLWEPVNLMERVVFVPA